MAYLYIDDGYPESQDYENNYIYFDARNSECVQRMEKLVQKLGTLPPQHRKIVLNKIRMEQQNLASV